MDVIDKVESFLSTCSSESRYLAIQFEADKLLFKRWAASVGIVDGNLRETRRATLEVSAMTEAKMLNLLGFANNAQSAAAKTVEGFITSLGLSYCEFLELTRAGLVSIRNNRTDAGTFPDCPSCCLSQLSLAIPSSGLALALALTGQ